MLLKLKYDTKRVWEKAAAYCKFKEETLKEKAERPGSNQNYDELTWSDEKHRRERGKRVQRYEKLLYNIVAIHFIIIFPCLLIPKPSCSSAMSELYAGIID